MKRKNNKFSRFGSWLRSLNPILFSLVLVAITTALTLTITAPVEIGWIQDVEFYPPPLDRDMPLWEMIMMAVVFAPLLETALLQTLPFIILRRFATFRRNRWAIVLIAALIFGSMHYYSALYMVTTTVAGAILMYGYIVKWKRHGYWNIVLFHALWNGIAILLKVLGIE